MSNYVLTETLSSTLITWYVLKRLVLPWVEWDAYKVGLIDDKGNKLKKAITSVERDAWTSFDRFMYNIRKVLEKFVGRSSLAHYLSAMYLLRDDLNLYHKHSVLNESEFDDFDAFKQQRLFLLFKKLDEHNIEPVSFEYLEHGIFKINKLVEEILSELENTTCLNEVKNEQEIMNHISKVGNDLDDEQLIIRIQIVFGVSRSTAIKLCNKKFNGRFGLQK